MLLFLSGIIFITVGYLFHKFPEKEINGGMGFRTKLSMKNQKNWDFAQKYGFKKMMQLGWIGFILGAIFFVSGTWRLESIMWMEMILLFIGFTLLLAKVEKEIEKQEGNSLCEWET